MRLTSLAVATLASLPAGSLAFAPNVNGPATRTPLTMNMANNDNDFQQSVKQAKNGIFSVFAASAIFLAPGPAMVDPAYAAVPSAASQAVIVPTTQVVTPVVAPTKAVVAPTKAVPKIVDPLATDKTNVDAAKVKYSATQSASVKAKKTLADANTAFIKAEDSAVAADKKVVATKKALIAANDKLADAKAKEGMNGGNLNAMKEVESLASKVGAYL